MRTTSAACVAAAVVAVAALAPAALAAPLPVTLDVAATRITTSAYDIRRETIATTGAASFQGRVEALPAGARLLTAIAVPAEQPDAPLRFRVTFESAGSTTTLVERVLTGGTADRRWFDVGIALDALAGRSGTLRFETSGVGWWAPPEVAVCPGDGTSLLLITIDALRADRLGSAGYGRPTSPRLDAFAADATRFSAAFTGGPKTIPSIPQILTGHHFYWQRPSRGLTDLLGHLPSHAIVNNPYVGVWLRNESPGFAAVHAGELDAHTITSAALRYLTAAGRCPTALYLHYLDTHTPYRVPARYARRFVDHSATTTIGLSFDDVTGAWQNAYGDADRQRIVDLYDGSILYTDRQVGRLLRGLARRGRLDRTLVIVTADHGEELWEHRQFFHGQSLYDELLHVPLLVRFPSVGRGRVVDDLVRSVDVLPTIADVMGRAATATDGRSLRPLAAGETDAERTAFALVSSAEPRTPERHAVRTKTAKLIRNVSDGQIEVYDLPADPKEKRNLGPAAPAAAALQTTLDEFRSQLDGKGYQLRVRGRPDRTVPYVVDVATVTPAPLVAIDRLSLEPDDVIAFKPRASGFSVSGTLGPHDEDHVRFDSLWGVGIVKITVRLDGAPTPGTLRLGARAVAGKNPIDLTSPELAGAPAAPAAGDPVTVELWRAAAVADATAPPALDDATRERLRQLGYVE